MHLFPHLTGGFTYLLHSFAAREPARRWWLPGLLANIVRSQAAVDTAILAEVHMKLFKGLSLSLAVAGTLTACGGGGLPSGPGATTTGVFRDAPVAGLWVQGSTGDAYTSAKGTFSYRPGETYTAYVGKVKLGSFVPDADNVTVTPASLVPESAANRETTILNLTRFLMTLDSDGDASNGISIAQALDDDALNWPQIDFTSSAAFDLSTNDGKPANAIMNGIVGSGGKTVAKGIKALTGTASYTSQSDARDHLVDSMACAYAGAYTSEQQLAGSVTSRLAFIMDGAGIISALQYLPQTNTSSYHFNAATAFDYSNLLADDSHFIAVDSDEQPALVKMDYRQSLLTPDKVYLHATATNELASAGVQTASRLAGLPTAVRRLAGVVHFPSDNDYVYQVEVDASNIVSGRLLNLKTGKSAALAGSYSYGSGKYTLAASGAVESSTISLTGDYSTSLNQWTPTATEDGLALASPLNVKGCKLN